MQTRPVPVLTAHDLGYNLPDGKPLFRNLQIHWSAGRLGLVGPNGCGKSTLLRLLSGSLKPSAGRIQTRGRIAFLPQDLEPLRAGRIADSLGQAEAWDAWARAESGRARAGDAETLAAQWDVEARCRDALERADLGYLSPDNPCARLSGGELVRVAVAGLGLDRPDILLLDEPTNHCDAASREALRRMLADWKGCVVVAGHDRSLLRSMEAIAEMSPSGLRQYGGGYAFYAQTRAAEDAASAARVAALEASLRKGKVESRRAVERQEKRAVRGARAAEHLGLPKILLGARKRKAQQSTAKLARVQDRKLAAERSALSEARAAQREDARVVLDADRGREAVNRSHLLAHGVNFRLPGGNWIWPVPLDLEIRGAERVAVQGRNGTGKSLLLGLIAGRILPACGSLRVGARRISLLDQALSGWDPGRSVFESLRAVADPGLSDAELRIRLARFHFEGDAAWKPVGVLSGGERMRAALVRVLAAGAEPDLLLLDEPTNHLDFAGQLALESALAGYRGAMVVVSHDPDFLSALEVRRSLTLERRKPGDASAT